MMKKSFLLQSFQVLATPFVGHKIPWIVSSESRHNWRRKRGEGGGKGGGMEEEERV